MKSSGFADYPWIQSFTVSFLAGLTLYLVRNADIGPDGSFTISFNSIEIILITVISSLIFALLAATLIRGRDSSNENPDVREDKSLWKAAQYMKELDEHEERMNELHAELLGDDDDSPRENN